MKRNTVVFGTLAVSAVAGTIFMFAQGPVVNIDSRHHPDLASAQASIVQAYQAIDRAQTAHHDQLGGHAARAKDLLVQADTELRAAATTANQNRR